MFLWHSDCQFKIIKWFNMWREWSGMHGMCCYYDVYLNTIPYQIGWKVCVAVWLPPSRLTSSIPWALSLYFKHSEHWWICISHRIHREFASSRNNILRFFLGYFLDGISDSDTAVCWIICVAYILLFVGERQTDYLIKVSTTFRVWFIDFAYPLFKLKKEKLLFGIYMRLVWMLLLLFGGCDVRSCNSRYHIQGLANK